MPFEQAPESRSQRVALGPLVETVLDEVAPTLPDELALRTRLDGRCIVTGPPSSFQRMVMLLLGNALGAMEGRWSNHPTVLDVATRRVGPDLAERYLSLDPQPYVHLSVSDTGPDASENRKRGAGGPLRARREGRAAANLRVSGARDIVEACTGALTVRAEPEEGTTVNVYLPLAGDPRSSRPDASVCAPSVAPRHVLVVDDDRTIRTLEEGRLAQLGHEVTTKRRGEEALAAAEEHPAAFDVALIDYHMPEMNGLELAHALRASGCEASLVLMTGLTAQVSEAKARIVGVDRLLTKPVGQNELRDVLTDVG